VVSVPKSPERDKGFSVELEVIEQRVGCAREIVIEEHLLLCVPDARHDV
jgi:hypothetical protein